MTKERKQEVINTYKREEKDTGSLNLSTATHLFANYTKKLYVNAANVIKIEYRNSSDVLQIANIND